MPYQLSRRARALVLAAFTMAVCTAARATAQTCVYSDTAPGLALDSWDWRGFRNGELPQKFYYDGWEDKFELTVDDGRSAGVASNEVVVVLESAVPWAKEIAAWNFLNGEVTAIRTNGVGQTMTMRLTQTTCANSPSTIVLRKAKQLGWMRDVYHIDPINFWRLYRGKVVTITWSTDNGMFFPAPCLGCIAAGTPARVPATKLVGDFNGDGASDIALLGPPGWTTVPVAFSNRNGSFNVTNLPAGDFAAWAAVPGVKILTGDFNGDGKTDIALAAGAGWGSLPVALSRGDGSFDVRNNPLPDFAAWAATPGVNILTGDFNGDRRTDIALTGPAGWTTIPVAFSAGDGSFQATNRGTFDAQAPWTLSAFPAWAATSGARVLAGDFDGDGRTDLAITGPHGWTTIPVAFARSGGTFAVTNLATSYWDFPSWASDPDAQAIAADFDGDGATDIALTGAKWTTVPIAYSRKDGSFRVANDSYGPFAGLAAAPGARVSVGDFNNDRRADLALTGPTWGGDYSIGYYTINGFEPMPASWNTVPVAFATGMTNAPNADFAAWAATPWVAVLVGDFNGDGRADLALTGPMGWASVPVAFSNGDGSFIVTNQPIGDFARWASAEWGTP